MSHFAIYVCLNVRNNLFLIPNSFFLYLKHTEIFVSSKSSKTKYLKSYSANEYPLKPMITYQPVPVAYYNEHISVL